MTNSRGNFRTVLAGHHIQGIPNYKNFNHQDKTPESYVGYLLGEIDRLP
jgi:hypothetical protein